MGEELYKMMKRLDEGEVPPEVDWDKVKNELHGTFICVHESLSVAGSICPMCGRPI